MATTSVLYAHRCDAKALKSRLEQESLLDKRFRMTPSASDATVVLPPSNNHHQDGESDLTAEEEGSGIIDAIVSGRCIAVPVIDDCIDRLKAVRKHTNTSDKDFSWETYVVAYGRQSCPFSTSTLGNQNHNMISSRLVQQQQKYDTIIEKSKSKNNNKVLSSNLNNIQYVLVKTMVDYLIENVIKKKSDNNKNVDQDELESFQKMVETSILSLSVKTCPKKLEVMGDDRTLVIPSTAFLINEDMTRTQEFYQLISKMIDKTSNTTNNSNTVYQIQENLWKNLASLYQSPRVVRRGDIDPENGKRESGHRLLWPLPESVTPSSTTEAAAITCTNHGYIPQTTGPDSPGWITVTEHKISQSFDLTRVMFSRGNVTEKKRFGSLVQPDEYVLDMYAGIGYYTLPALIHGHARHVTSCEWNPNAIFALRYNLKSNRVGDRATVLEGDCRVTLRDLIAKNNHYFDRISLGLLPSSEGGWPIAVECLNREKGGWLHVHGNVPTVERHQWAHWLCRSLISQKNEHSKDWHAICSHIERVKSFAPKVDHFVADVFLGPLNSPHLSCRDGLASTTGVIDSGVFTATPRDVSPPSCALGTGGVLHQEWMVGSK